MPEFIRVRVGEEFDITLKGIPTAGFAWKLVSTSEGKEVVEQVGDRWEVTPNIIGGVAQQLLRFRALAFGEVVLHFQYTRPWEAKPRDERSFLVRVERA